MNKSYKSVWNESTGSWVAVSELATGRSKSKRAKTSISKTILTQVAVGGMSLAGAGAAMAADDSLAYGNNAIVQIADGVAIGVNSEVDADTAAPTKIGGIAIGDSAYSMGSGVAVGKDSQASSDSLAFGAAATAGNGGTAIGANAYTINNGGVALGQNASATGAGAMAFGLNSSASGSGSLALGQDSVATDKNTVSIGNTTTQRKITNMAAGTAATDAVNVGQLTAAGLIIGTSGAATNAFVAYDTTAKSKITLGGGTAGTTITNVKAGALTASSTDAINGSQLFSVQTDVNALKNAPPGSNPYVSIGALTNNAGPATTAVAGDIAIGVRANAAGSGSMQAIAMGMDSSAVGVQSIAIGSTATASLNGDTAIGTNSVATGGGSYSSATALGYAAGATGSLSVALGRGASASGASSVALGANSVADQDKSVSVGSSSLKRKIVNVAAGTSTNDAVNFGQLTAAGLAVDTSGNATNAFVAYDTTAKSKITLGGGTAGTTISNLKAGTAATDAVNLGQLTAAGLSLDTTGKATNAFVAYDSTAKTGVTLGTGTVGAQIHQVVAGVADTDATNVAQLKALGAIIGSSGTVTNSFVSYSTTGKDLVTLLGTAGTKISNVAAGTINSTSKDAVNGSQLYAAENSVAAVLGGSAGVNADGTIKAPTYTVGGKTYNTLDTALTAAAASGGSGGSVNGVNYDQDGHTSVTLGTGTAGAQIHQVVAGTTATDAVNLAQLSSATSGLSTVVGNAKYIGISTVMSGSQAQATGNNAVSIGGNAFANGDNSLAFGTNSKATALNSIAIGYGSTANQANTVSFGSLGKERRLTNVADGSADTDAVNFGQVTQMLSQQSNAVQAVLKSSPTLLGASKPALLGAGATGLLGDVTPITLNQVIAVGPTDKLGSIQAIGTDSVSIGLNTSSTNTNSVAIGSNISSVGANSVAMGYGTISNGANSVSFGSNATSVSDGGLSIGNSSAVDVDSPDGIAIGTNAESANDRAIVIGKNSGATGVQSVVLGNSSMARADGSFVLGNNSTVTGANTYVLGSNNTKVSGSNSVVLGNGSDGTQSNVISVGGKGSERKIVNVAAGTTTTDAVNLGQMTTAISTAVGTSNPNAVSYDSSAHDKITLGTTGTAGTPVTIANVADGKADNDAVNVEQLKAAGLKVDTSGVVQNAFVAYDSTAETSVTLGKGTAGAQIHQVVAGSTATDAVNLGQLTAAGLTVDTAGKATNAFVAYDSTAKTGVTLGTGTVGAQIHQVVAGTTATDAVNLGQLTAAGLKVDTKGVATNAFVAYDSTAKTGVTLGTGTVGAQIHQVVAGVADTDATNVAQLKAMGATFNSSGVVQNAFVAYDSTAETSVTLGKGTAGAQIHNLVAGATATDAVNLGQLKAAGLKVDTSGVVQNAFVAYDSTAKTGVTLGTGTVGAQIHQVVAGTTGTDAVNLAQLTAAGLTVDTAGKATNAFVAYDSTAKTGVTLGTGTVGAQIHQVVAGTTATDAVNLGQLTAAGLKVDTKGVAQNAFVAYDSTAKTDVTLGTGTVGAQIHQVVAGVADTDATNVAQLKAMGATFNSSGVVQNAFVAYDSTAETSVTLGKGTAGAQIHNLVAGATATDAVNLGQLTAAGLKVDTSGVVQNAFVAYDSTAKTGVTLGTGTVGAQIHQVVAGSTATDAVNLGQLTAAGLKVDTSGVATNAFVAYDSTAETSVTLGKGTAGAQIHQVVAGSTATDAVNLGQLTAAGLTVDTAGKATNAFVAYDSTAKTGVTLGTGTVGAQIHQVVAGTTTTDAVNLGQLTAAGLKVDTKGVATNAFVAYDSTAKTSVTLGTGTVGAQIHQVVAGTTTTDAVNLGQMTTAIASAVTTGGLNPNAVSYDSSAHDKITLGTTGAPVTIANVADGKADNDAVNVAQLKAAGLNVDTSGVVQNAFVAYDSTAKTGVTLGDGTAGAQIHNLVAGTADTDATNVGQLKAAGLNIDTSGVVQNAFVAYDSTAKTSVTLGDGTVGAQIHNLVAGTTATDAVNLGQLTAAGLIVNSNGVAQNAFVAYDSTAKTSVTLGKAGTPVKVANVADGVANNDAVNVEQMTNAISTATSGNKVLSDSLKYVRFGASAAATAQATGSDSIAIGGNAFANSTGGLAFGLNSRATGKNSVALGTGSLASVDNTVSVGTQFAQRKIVNVADGEDANDAVNLGQVEEMLKTATVAQTPVKSVQKLAAGKLGSNADGTPATVFALTDVMGVGTTDKLNQVETSGTDSIAIGLNTKANADNTVSIGTNVSATADSAVAIGSAVIANGAGATAIGVNASVVADRALAIGNGTDAESIDSIALGTKAAVGGAGTNGIAIGTNAAVAGSGTIVMGNNSSASGTDTVVIGNNITGSKAKSYALGNNSVILGAGSDGSQSNVVSIGAAGKERKIVNVAAGTTTTDAVNVGQLNSAIAAAGTGGGGSTLITQAAAGADLLVGGATDGTHVNFANNGGVARELLGVAAGTKDTSAVNLAQLKPVVTALGGGAGVDAAGKVTGPSYSIGGHTTTNVGDAFKDVDAGLTNVNNAVAAITADSGGLGLVAQDATTQNITVGKLTGGTVVDVTNSSGVQRTITGVAAGAVNSSSFDAINGSQLAGVSSSFATAIGGGAMMNPDGSITQPTFNVGGGTVHNVGDAISNLDSRVTSNTTDVQNLQTTVNNITAGGGVATPNAVAYDSSAHDQITLAGNGTAGTKLTNLAAGDISSADSTDAVTGGQLYATNAEVAALQNTVQNFNSTGTAGIGINGINGANGADGAPAAAASATGSDAIAMGDGASASGDHAVVIGGGASGTGDGTIAIGGNAGASGKDSIAIGNGATAPANNAVALGANSMADRDNSVSVGSEGAERQITNVAAGTQGTDAVNLNQMNSAVGGIARKAYSGIAAATALTMIPDVDANKTLSIGIGGGTFQGYAATAIGGTARITQNIKVRVGAGWSAAGTTVGAGASYQW